MDVKVLHDHGWSVNWLAREFGLSRITIRRELSSETPRGRVAAATYCIVRDTTALGY